MGKTRTNNKLYVYRIITYTCYSIVSHRRGLKQEVDVTEPFQVTAIWKFIVTCVGGSKVPPVQ